MIILSLFTYLLPAFIVVLVVIIVLIIYRLFKKNRQKPSNFLDTAFFEEAMIALGDITNIKHIEQIQRRVQIELDKIGKVDTKKLKSLSISAFLTGKKITLLLNEQAEAFLNYIKQKRNEER